ncbi:uracil-DNA glycosylase [Marivivens niveibacter]|uniref:Type-4 uracil-DNA glycosylase n=1 Tax=Marivivens niveibacter TaxID=1930667 RepID=A0A251X1P1_9RHOB|nr:uracil-DNA glycosylase [Marivivens niveibacter]OUD10083.1 uracil-DNA glycosylase [Marivivens niveibacter]
MDSAVDYWTARALLEWQVEMGADEAILDTPVDRYVIPEPVAPTPAAANIQQPPTVPIKPDIDPVVEAKSAAGGAGTIEALRSAMESFDHCELKKGARSFVFADGNPEARLMIVSEAPNRDEDQQGKPMVGQIGALFDKMFGAIGLDRSGLYVVPAIPWRPPANRAPSKRDLEIMGPFLQRHIELVQPDVIVLMGNCACQALIGQGGITRSRGNWTKVLGRDAVPMCDPDYLMSRPVAKRDAWADLLSIKSKLGI